MPKELSIFIADDRNEFSGLFFEVSGMLGGCYEVGTAKSLAGAIEYFDRLSGSGANAPDLIFINLDMENEAALHILEHWLDGAMHCNIPVCAYVGEEANNSLIKKAYSLMANCCISLSGSYEEKLVTIARVWEYWTETVTFLSGNFTRSELSNANGFV
jgi:hypothetical protein